MNSYEQRLAITIGGLLLLGGTLVCQAVTGTWVTFTAGAALIIVTYVVPMAHEELAVRRFARRLRRATSPTADDGIDG
ncbi:hypothetical protein LUZ28_07475 [Streptomyces albireticuli]|uniref:hypothetical protein n=1 Tax=Streptomyces albireticuli TaxID=1940 RepID=UPI001E388CA8|nr:hypothetical protein [Streptomyces albireticuli]MCD9144347.1 hypothetical protein [Streptomyces albireticuli]MCD9162010.1 hypothetical protein [Streptomyces albireticuli]